METNRRQDYLYEQLSEHLEKQISEGIYQIGDKLPSIRALSNQRQVSVATVLQALSLIEAKGVVEARSKSGYYVRQQRFQRAPAPPPPKADLRPQTVGVSDCVARVFRQTVGDTSVPLGAGIPAPSLLPLQSLSRLMSCEVRNQFAQLGSYGNVAGHSKFIRELLRYLNSHGCEIAKDELLITSGIMESMNLAIRSVTKPGDIVAVESPCYFGILELLESLLKGQQ